MYMIQATETAYWLAMAYASHLPLTRVKTIVAHWCLQQHQPLSRLFTSLPNHTAERLGFTEQDKHGIRTAGARLAQCETWRASLASKGVQVITQAESSYPAALSRYLPAPARPLFLFAQGNPALLSRASVAIVGAQSATPERVTVAHEVAALLAEAGLPVITGLGKGVGRAVADGALSVANGQVVAVLPVGIYRALGLSQALTDAVGQGRALLLSPFHPTVRFTLTRALARDRLMAALADALLIIEATEAGAEREMAEQMLGYNKPVCVWDVGSGDSQTPAGNQALIEAGGLPVSELADVLELVESLQAADIRQTPQASRVPPWPEVRAAEADATFDPDSTLELLTRSGRVPEALMRRLGHKPA